MPACVNAPHIATRPPSGLLEIQLIRDSRPMTGFFKPAEDVDVLQSLDYMNHSLLDPVATGTAGLNA